ncbi:FAD/NAD(P)-binding protein [Dickeya dadantii]|uniref:FAD/NAD(P)-binding protein n=1 Tax=Dickeya dadantii TaxID=204038 RepID=UPI001C0D9E18|nr:FAD/NAD(P)-binding protein [Dickeya dadantii]QWT40253.1 FAD/NAD(P)-binding protein [Dickeya dadantii]
MYDIAIVGLGATGVSLLSQIQDEIYKLKAIKPKVAVFNPASTFASGKAFGDADSMHKVNTPPAMMSVSATEPDRFGHWLQSVFSSEERWPARLKYSNFIRQTYRDIKSAGILHITEFHHSATHIRKNDRGFTLTDENGNTVDAHKIVMCMGSLSADTFPEFNALPGFTTHFTQYDAAINEPLIIAGSGLTAIDAFRYAQSKSNANIHLYSRSGYAPTCLTERNTYTPVYLNWRNIMAASADSEDVLGVFTRLLRKEFSLLKERDEFKPAMQLLRAGRQADYFRLLLNRAKNSELPWQDVLVSTRPYMHRLWNALTLAQKQQFLKRYGALWAAWRHPVPQEVFAELAQASAEGRLQFHQAVSRPLHQDRQFILKTTSGTLAARQFWDATGGSQTLEKVRQPLLQNLLSQRLIEGHPCGGINIDPLTFQCRVQGRNIQGLYNLGPLSKGSLFSTNAFWFNARCAETWAKQWVLEYSTDDIKESM